jgi:eukaryotic-like serine/threonine-protein kinase
MTPERWAQVRALFDDAVDQDPETREAFLNQACGEDADLLREVSAMLHPAEQSGSFLDEPHEAAAAIRRAFPATDKLEGARLGPWKLLRRIGSGGMGCVYAAARADQQFSKIVAIKIVNPGADSEEVLRRFDNERRVLAALEHPNIARLLDGGTSSDNVPYLVMEYVEGVAIDRFCDSQRLTVHERLELFRSVCAAVQYAHQNLVVHRDLKPANILVTKEGAAKLLDFGIAKLLRPDFAGDGVLMTRTQAHPMTPAFASPEQIRGEPITTASDIYSLGVILYRILAGRHPYELKMQTVLELERAICENDPEKPSHTAPRPPESGQPEFLIEPRLLRGDLDTIVLMAMRKEPRRRYPSVEHLSEDIRRYLGGFPVTARKAGAWYRITKFIGRHQAASIAGFALSAALVAAGTIAVREKAAAERRFEDLRSFANFVLNDFDDAVREGPTPARTKLASKGVEYLDKLAREKSSPEVRRDLVAGYLKNGDVQGNLFGASLGETARAEQSYRKALAIAEELMRENPASTRDRHSVIVAHTKLGEALSSSGNRREAIAQYDAAFQAATALAPADPGDPAALAERMNLWAGIGSAQSLLLDPAGALESYRLALGVAEKLPASFPRRSNAVAFLREQAAYYSALSGDPAGADDAIRQSIAVYEANLATDARPARRRNLAKAYKNLAEVEHRAAKNSEALEAVIKSLQITDALIAEDPRNESYQIDRHQAAMLEITLLASSGRTEEAREATRRAIAQMKANADPPQAPFHYAADVAELLATTAFADLRDGVAALHYAHRAAELTRELDPEVLHVLALAYEANGDPKRAVDANRRALALLPDGRTSEFRRSLEAEISRSSK